MTDVRVNFKLMAESTAQYKKQTYHSHMDSPQKSM